MAFLLVLIIVDSGLSFKMLAFNSTPFPDTVNMLRQTVDVTGQRVALMDLSEFGSFPLFIFVPGKTIPSMRTGGMAGCGNGFKHCIA